MSELSEIEKICFSCVLPAERCCKRNTLCKFNEATQYNQHLRTKSTKIQHSCGFPEKDLLLSD